MALPDPIRSQPLKAAERKHVRDDAGSVDLAQRFFDNVADMIAERRPFDPRSASAPDLERLEAATALSTSTK